MSRELEDFKASYVSSQDKDSNKRLQLLHDYSEDSQANNSMINDTLTDENMSINSSQKKIQKKHRKRNKQYLDNSASEGFIDGRN